MGRPALNLIGRKFFRLTPIRKVDERYDGHHTYWECKCDCGNTIIVRKDSLISGHAKSCGCYLEERKMGNYAVTHGESHSRLYKIWLGMKYRCLNCNCPEYDNYGGRGITVCDEWENSYLSFKEWSENNGYDERLNRMEQSIDRIDVNGNYEPSNCRWADKETQDYNKRDTRRVLVNGIEMTLKEISDTFGIPIVRVRSRYQRCKVGLITVEELISKEKLKSKTQAIWITVGGITNNLTGWEKETGISRKTISERYKRGARTAEELFGRGYK